MILIINRSGLNWNWFHFGGHFCFQFPFIHEPNQPTDSMAAGLFNK